MRNRTKTILHRTNEKINKVKRKANVRCAFVASA